MTDFLDLLTSVTLNDLELPQKGFLVNFLQFLDAAHISTFNCDEMAKINQENLHMKFLVLNVDFNSPISNP